MLDRLEILANNVSALGMELSQELTIPRQVTAIQERLNALIDEINGLEKIGNDYTDKSIEIVNQTIADLKKTLEDGTYLKDGSIDLSKLNTSFMDDLHTLMIRQLSESCKMVIPTIDDSGHYCFDIPSNWSQIDFEFCEDGHLELICYDE